MMRAYIFGSFYFAVTKILAMHIENEIYTPNCRTFRLVCTFSIQQ